MYKISNYIVPVTIKGGMLIFSTRTGDLQHLKRRIFEQIQKSDYSKIDQDVIEQLLRSKVLIPKDEDEYIDIISNLKLKSLNLLGFTILPSSDCQLGCSYCGQEHKKNKMDDKMCKNVIDYILARMATKTIHELDITWYGAEPLLNRRAIELISKALIDECLRINLKYSSSMVTNGLAMTEKVFVQMVNLGITTFQITLDGDQGSHDNSRPTKGNGKTFETIIKNIIDATRNPIYESKGCEIIIRCNIHKYNFKSIDSLIDIFHSHGIADKLLVYFHPVRDWGGNMANKAIGLHGKKFGLLEIEWMLKLKELGFRAFKDVLPEVITYRYCEAISRDTEIIDSYGRLSLCWEVPHTPKFDYPGSKLIRGSILAPSEIENRDNLPFADWIRDIEEGEYGIPCKQCKYLPVCLGSCPIRWYSGTGECPQFIYNIKDRMVFNYIMTLEEKQKNEKIAST